LKAPFFHAHRRGKNLPSVQQKAAYRHLITENKEKGTRIILIHISEKYAWFIRVKVKVKLIL
jgi:hypothetical protein